MNREKDRGGINSNGTGATLSPTFVGSLVNPVMSHRMEQRTAWMQCRDSSGDIDTVDGKTQSGSPGASRAKAKARKTSTLGGRLDHLLQVSVLGFPSSGGSG